jgi:calcium-dependent protein kinase
MRIFEFTSDGSYYYIISEYIPNGELFDEIIRRKFLSEEDGAYVVKQLISAITYCHAKGVVHRDLKPENILIDSITEGNKINIKVIDFGTAMFFSPDREIEGTLGTPYYVAPEVLMGTYTEKCDTWSIGVILFVLLSGSAPFNGKSDEEILAAVKKGKFAFRSI